MAADKAKARILILSLEQNTALLLQKANVVGVGIGDKIKSGVTVQRWKCSDGCVYCERFLRSNLLKTASSLSLLAVTHSLPRAELLQSGLSLRRPCLKVYVEKKPPLSKLTKKDIIPLVLSAAETDVEEVGKIRALGLTGRVRPALEGSA